MFRVIIRAENGGASAISQPLDLVTSQRAHLLLRVKGHNAELVPDTRDLTRLFAVPGLGIHVKVPAPYPPDFIQQAVDRATRSNHKPK